MLVPVQPSGSKPPLFFVHGLHGVMPLGTGLARVLGSDQPFYALNASGIGGQGPVLHTVRDMALAYVAEIQEARATGPVVVGGMCDGSLAAIEIARELQQRGRKLGPVILADPTVIPRGYSRLADGPRPEVAGGPAAVEMARQVRDQARQAGTVIPADPVAVPDPNNLRPEVERQLYQRVHDQLLAYASLPYNSLPFDAGDPQQLHLASLAGVGSLIALSSHLPAPFPGPAQVILSAGRRSFGFFHREMPWHSLLLGPRMVHVLPWDHLELFKEGREHVARAIRFMLQEGPRLAGFAGRSTKPAVPRTEPSVADLGDIAARQA